MALVIVPKENTRVPKKIGRGPEFPPGSFIVRYVTGKNDRRINKEMIMEILESVGIDTGGNVFHKVRIAGGAEVYVDDAGLAIVVAP